MADRQRSTRFAAAALLVAAGLSAQRTNLWSFATRALDHPTLIRLELRRSAEGLGQWLAFHRQLVRRARELHRRNADRR